MASLPSGRVAGEAAPAASLDAWSPLLATLFEHHPDGALLLRLDGSVAAASGWPDPAESYLAKSSRDALRASIARALAGQASAFDALTAAAPARTLRICAAPVASGGATLGALLTASDITEHVENERRLKRIESLMIDAQGTAHMGTWEWDVSQPHAWWSEELYRIYGLTPETYTPSYEAYLTMVHPDDRERVAKATERVFQQHIPYSHDERIYRPNGDMRYLHTWAHPVVDDEGKLLRLVGVCQDVTDLRAAERTQTLARDLVRRLVVDLLRQAHVPERTMRELGRSLAAERPMGARVEPYVEAFCDMGLGQLRHESTHEHQMRFVGSDLLERQADATLPTCALTLGYLEGAVSAIAGKRALGTELRCQSTGGAECVFVVRVPGGETPA